MKSIDVFPKFCWFCKLEAYHDIHKIYKLENLYVYSGIIIC